MNVNSLKSLRPVFGETALADIAPEAIENYLTDVFSRRRIRNQTRNQIGRRYQTGNGASGASGVEHILNVAVKQKRLATKPCVAVEFPVSVKRSTESRTT